MTFFSGFIAGCGVGAIVGILYIMEKMRDSQNRSGHMSYLVTIVTDFFAKDAEVKNKWRQYLKDLKDKQFCESDIQPPLGFFNHDDEFRLLNEEFLNSTEEKNES